MRDDNEMPDGGGIIERCEKCGPEPGIKEMKLWHGVAVVDVVRQTEWMPARRQEPEVTWGSPAMRVRHGKALRQVRTVLEDEEALV